MDSNNTTCSEHTWVVQNALIAYEKCSCGSTRLTTKSKLAAFKRKKQEGIHENINYTSITDNQLFHL